MGSLVQRSQNRKYKRIQQDVGIKCRFTEPDVDILEEREFVMAPPVKFRGGSNSRGPKNNKRARRSRKSKQFRSSNQGGNSNGHRNGHRNGRRKGKHKGKNNGNSPVKYKDKRGGRRGPPKKAKPRS